MPCGDAHVHNPRNRRSAEQAERLNRQQLLQRGSPGWASSAGGAGRPSGCAVDALDACLSGLLRRGEGVTCNGHEAERSAQADRGVRGACREGGVQPVQVRGPGAVVVGFVMGGPLGRSTLTLGGCTISGGPLVQALGDFWRPFGESGWNRTAKMPSRGPGQSRT